MTKIEVVKILSDGRVKGISYKELSDEGIPQVIEKLKKANALREATLRGEYYKYGWFHGRHLKREIKEYEKEIKILFEELERRSHCMGRKNK